ncbi:hypothetical protein D7030_03985 [Flavobacteriaceae bacterium AU392]|nr:hypothetical protein D1817_10460 [Flavobacteriaceae bacterium]RKM85836.1 hypothetical protein D7030_03985 [Flavobacteriaceae bacterium AU392]
MTNHYQLNDAEFQKQFKNGTLDPKLFNHEAHLRLAWIYITQDGVETAVDLICNQLLNYVTVLGAVDKFNKTVTVAAVRAVYHFMLKSDTDDFKTFIAELPRLKYNFKELLASHYNIDVFNSKIAKSTFLEPDLLSFD